MAELAKTFARKEAAPQFERPDLAALSRQLNLLKRSAPLEGASALSALERDIAAKAAAGAARVRASAGRLLAEAEAQARKSDAAPLEVDQFVSRVELDIAGVEARLFEPLVRARLEERRRWRELRRFKIDHGLERDASYADTALEPAANLALLVALESAANALLLQTASASGYVGGFLIAVVMSLVTVAMGALFAGLLGVRLMRRRGIGFQLLGGSIFAAALAFSALWAFALARYRDVAMASAAGIPTGRVAKKAGKAASDAVPQSAGLFGPADGPILGFGSLESLALVVLGLVVFVLATLKGAGGRGGFTDSYWGYKPRHAAHRAAEEAYEDEQEEYREALEEVVDEAKEAIEKAASNAAQRSVQMRSACDRGLSAAALAAMAVDDWNDAYTELLRRADILGGVGGEPKHDLSDAGLNRGFDHPAISKLHDLRDQCDVARSADSAVAAAARRALGERLREAQERLAKRVEAAELEADRRLGEEIAALTGPDRTSFL